MKKMMLILVMLLIAATSYNQTSRKSANSKETATKRPSRSEQVSRSGSSSNAHAQQERRTETRSNEQRNNREATRTAKQPNTSRSTTRQVSNSGSSGRSSDRSSTTTNTRRSTTTTNRSTSRSSTVVADPASRNYHTDRPADHRNRQVVEYSSPRTYRSTHQVHHHYSTPPRSIEYRRVHYVYRRPSYIEFYWTPAMHRHFVEIYPMVHHWKYRNGYRIDMISAYDAMYYRGEVMTVYGRVNEVFYSRNTDEYFLYFGPYYPYQDFTVVIPGYLARSFSRRPERFFTNRDMAVTGLITTYEGEPEIVVKRDFQINLY